MEQDCNDKKTTAMADTPPGPDCFKHLTDIQIRFNDIDMLGHLNNTMYFSYFDIGKADYFNAIRRTDNHWGHLDIVIREFGIRKNKKKTWKKLVISPVFCIFIVENQNITKSTGDDYQRQSYRDFLYYR